VLAEGFQIRTSQIEQDSNYLFALVRYGSGPSTASYKVIKVSKGDGHVSTVSQGTGVAIDIRLDGSNVYLLGQSPNGESFLNRISKDGTSYETVLNGIIGASVDGDIYFAYPCESGCVARIAKMNDKKEKTDLIAINYTIFAPLISDSNSIFWEVYSDNLLQIQKLDKATGEIGNVSDFVDEYFLQLTLGGNDLIWKSKPFSPGIRISPKTGFAPQTLVDGRKDINNIIGDNGYVYWLDNYGESVLRAPINQTPSIDTVASSSGYDINSRFISSFTIDDKSVYWIEATGKSSDGSYDAVIKHSPKAGC